MPSSPQGHTVAEVGIGVNTFSAAAARHLAFQPRPRTTVRVNLRNRIEVVRNAREDAIQDLQQPLDAVGTLRADLRTCEDMYRRTAKGLARGADVATVMKSARLGDARGVAVDSLDDFEYYRHQSRLSLAAAGLDEGMRVGQMSRAWGISRQQVARYAKEARRYA